MYIAGTDGAAAAAAYTVTLTVNNTSTTLTNAIASLLATLPPTYNAAGVKITAATVNGTVCPTTGANAFCTWTVSPAANYESGATSNQLYLWDSGMKTPSTTNAIAATKNATFTLSFPMWQTSSPYADTTLSANPDGGCPPTYKTNCTTTYSAFALGATGATTTAVVPTATLDSTELGIYSLNPTLMTSSFSPPTVSTNANETSVWSFTNTSTGQDANPDYIDKFVLTPPTGMMPTAITFSSGPWGAYKSGTTWVFTLCGSATCTPTAAQYQNALAPGASLSATFTFGTAPTAGTYSMPWTVEGANGGATSAAGSTALAVSSIDANVGFTYSTGFFGNPATAGVAPAVASGAEPTTGSDADPTYGTTFVYQISNIGSSAITSATVTIPYQDRFLNTPAASSGTNIFTLTGAPYVTGAGVGTAGAGCNGAVAAANYASSTTTATGKIVLTNCNIAPNQSISIVFNMKVPYAISSEFVFPSTVNGTTTAVAGYTAANYLKIIPDAHLTIAVPTGGGNVPVYSGESATASCTGTLCAWNGTNSATPDNTSSGAPANLAFGTITSTNTYTNVLNASVSSDLSGSEGWQLLVTADVNPTSASKTGTLYTWSSTYAGINSSVTLANTSQPTTPVPTGGTTQTIASFTGAASPSRVAIDNLMNFGISFSPTVTQGPQSINLTYTLVTN